MNDKPEIELNISPPLSVGNDIEKKDLILPKNNEISDNIIFSENENSSYLGNLIPVQSGHNGCLSPDEISILEYHIRNSYLFKQTLN